MLNQSLPNRVILFQCFLPIFHLDASVLSFGALVELPNQIDVTMLVQNLHWTVICIHFFDAHVKKYTVSMCIPIGFHLFWLYHLDAQQYVYYPSIFVHQR